MPQKFKDVPESWKYPNSNYRQAPAEFGGEWWYTDFVTGPEPWKTEAFVPAYPAGFLETFGPRPTLSEFRGLPNPRALWDAARNRWDQDLRYFQKAGWPDWPEITPERVQIVESEFQVWGMGTPRPYLGRYDWRVRFPESQIRDFEAGVYGAVTAPHLDIVRYQVRLLVDYGVVPARKHPWVPPQLWPAETKTS